MKASILICLMLASICSASPDDYLSPLDFGLSLLEHGRIDYGNIPPDVIVIYQDPIVRFSATDEEIKKRVQEVVLHEVGHYFGLDEKDLRKIEKDID